MVTSKDEVVRYLHDTLTISKELSPFVAKLAQQHKMPPYRMAIAVIMTGYSLLKLSLPPWDVEPKFYEAAKIAKGIFDMTDKVKDGNQG